VSPIAVALLVAAVVLVVATEWTRIAGRFRGSSGLGGSARQARKREKRKANLRVVRPDSEEFARSVERDLASLPTIDERDAKRR
jgi:uncharacterized membrane protein YcjF (UPF0283 family)